MKYTESIGGIYKRLEGDLKETINPINQKEKENECIDMLDRAEQIFFDLGIPLVDREGNLRSMTDIFNDLREKFSEGEEDLQEIDEDEMKAQIGDYIIKGVNGELYPCKPDIFNKTYGRVSE